LNGIVLSVNLFQLIIENIVPIVIRCYFERVLAQENLVCTRTIIVIVTAAVIVYRLCYTLKNRTLGNPNLHNDKRDAMLISETD
jgi:hypothetical protein